jgi:hypothetical protein
MGAGTMRVRTSIAIGFIAVAFLVISIPEADARRPRDCFRSGYGWDGKNHCNLRRWNRRHHNPRKTSEITLPARVI